jgi:ABC-type branched-subunit amino acid transport system substrate-binding protein
MSARRCRQVTALSAVLVLAVAGCATTLDHTATISANGKVSTTAPRLSGTHHPAGAGHRAGGRGARGHARTGGAATGTATIAGTAPTSGRGNTGAGGSSTAPVGTTPAPPIKYSQGITATTIKIGAFVASYEGLEAKGLNLGDAKVQVQAVANYINAHGGIAGRKVVLTFATMQATSSNWEADEQKICTQFTEDDHVFAVVYSLISMGKALLPCLAQHNTPLIAAGGGPGDAQVMQQYADDYVYGGGMNLTRVAQTYVDHLSAQGFFGVGAKIGLVRANDASFTRAASALKSRLAAHGARLTKEVVVDAQTSVSGTASQMPNAVLKMQQAGVNRVLFLDNATLAVLFAIQAASQNYYPRYGLTSLDAAATLMEPNVPAKALAGSAGVGWIPTLDVSATHDVGLNAPQKLCQQLMVAAGQGNVSRAGQNQQRLYCDGLFFLQRTLAHATELTPKGLRAQLEKLGTSYTSAMTFGTSFGPGRHDGADTVRNIAYSTGCSCFQYVGRPSSA